MTHRMVPLGLAVAIFALPAFAAGADLKPKFKSGSEVYYLTTMRQNITQKMQADPSQPAQEMKMVLKSETGSVLKCKEVKPDGSAVLEWTLLYLAMYMEGGMPLDYDSRDPAKTSSPMAGAFSPMLNQPAVITVDALGKITDYKDPASLEGGPGADLAGELFSKDAFLDSNLLLPGDVPKGAEAGATWSFTRPEELGGGMGTGSVTTNYRVEGLKEGGKLAELGLQGTLSLKQPEAAGGSTPPPPPLTIEKGTRSGKLVWDCAAGQLNSLEGQETFVGSLAAPKMTLESNGVTKVRRVTTEEFQQAAKKPAAAPAQPSDKPGGEKEKTPPAGEDPSKKP